MTTFDVALHQVRSSLGSPYSPGSGSLALATGGGAQFGSTFPVRVTVVQLASYGSTAEVETIYQVAGRTGDTLTGVSAIEGTTDQAFSTGDVVEMRWTAGAATAIQAAVNAIESAPYAVNTTVVHLAGTETITGAKTFSSPITGSVTGTAAGITGTVAGSQVSGNIGGNAASITGSITTSQVTGLVGTLATLAPLASPTFTGSITTPEVNFGTEGGTIGSPAGTTLWTFQPTDPAKGPWQMVAYDGLFVTTHDSVLSIGYNVSSANTYALSTEPIWRMNFEQDYWNAGTSAHAAEWYVEYIPTPGGPSGTQWRPFGCSLNRATAAVNVSCEIGPSGDPNYGLFAVTTQGANLFAVTATQVSTYKPTIIYSTLQTTVSTAVNNSLYYALQLNIGADATLGPLEAGLAAYPSATGANRYALLWAGDSAANRTIYFNSTSGTSVNGAGQLSTPQLTVTGSTTLATSLGGLLKATSGVVSTAAAGTDYLTPTGSGAGLTGITESQVSGLVSDLAAKAPLASPTFTGNVTVTVASAANGVLDYALQLNVGTDGTLGPLSVGLAAYPSATASNRYALLYAGDSSNNRTIYFQSTAGASVNGSGQLNTPILGVGGINASYPATIQTSTSGTALRVAQTNASGGTGAWISATGAGSANNAITATATGATTNTGLTTTCGTGANDLAISATGAAKIAGNATGSVQLTVNGPTGQTASLQQWQVNGSALSFIRADGSLALPTLADASAVNSSLYFSSTTSKLCYKDSSGTLHAV